MALLKSVQIHFKVTGNQNIEVYSDPEMTNPVPAYYIGDIPRGESREQTMYVKNLGEPVNLAITSTTPYATITPDMLTLAHDESSRVDFMIDVPWDAPQETYDGFIEINSL